MTETATDTAAVTIAETETEPFGALPRAHVRADRNGPFVVLGHRDRRGLLHMIPMRGDQALALAAELTRVATAPGPTPGDGGEGAS